MALRALRALDRRTPAERKFATAAVAWTVLSGAGFAIHVLDLREALRTLHALRCLGLTGRHREVATAHLRRATVRTTVKGIYTAIGFDALLNPRPPDYPPPRVLPVAGLIVSVILLHAQSLLDLREQRRTLGRFRSTMLRRAGKAGLFNADGTARDMVKDAVEEYGRLKREKEARTGILANAGPHPLGEGSVLKTRSAEIE